MDKLDEIFYRQAGFDNRLSVERGLDYGDTSEWIQRGVLAMMSELAELLDATRSWKWWKNPEPIDRENLKEELVDILHFYVSTCLKAGFTSEDLFDAYIEKNRENHDRQDGKSRKGYEPSSSTEVNLCDICQFNDTCRDPITLLAKEETVSLCDSCQLSRMCERYRRVEDACLDPIIPGRAIIVKCEAYRQETQVEEVD